MFDIYRYKDVVHLFSPPVQNACLAFDRETILLGMIPHAAMQKLNALHSQETEKGINRIHNLT
jgi:hypothetical protein